MVIFQKKEKCRKKAEVKNMSEESEKPNESQQLDDPKDPKQPDDKPKVNVLFGSTFTLFKRKLAVVCEKVGDKGCTLLLVPTKTDTEGISFGEMKDEIKKIFGDDIQNDQLDSVDNNDARFFLTMAYLYIEFEEKTEEGKTTQKRKKVEFAFQVTAKGLNNLLPKDLPIQLDDFQLAIWSTDRNKIIEEMHLITPKKFLETWN